MNCPICKHPETKVVDKRDKKNQRINRRRECLECLTRFTTVEIIQAQSIDKKVLSMTGTSQRSLRTTSKICTVKGCENKHEAKGLCRNHYNQQWMKGRNKMCKVDGCGGIEKSRGLCAKHYTRKRRGGETA